MVIIKTGFLISSIKVGFDCKPYGHTSICLVLVIEMIISSSMINRKILLNSNTYLFIDMVFANNLLYFLWLTKFQVHTSSEIFLCRTCNIKTEESEIYHLKRGF